MRPQQRIRTVASCLLFALPALAAAQFSASPQSVNPFAPEPYRFVHDRDTMDRRIDKFLSDWQGSLPRAEHGSLVLRDILTRGDNFAPPQIGATLQYANFLALGRLAPGASTTPSTLDRQQEIYYITGGQGVITAAGVTAPLHKDIAVLMPEDLSFVMRSIGDTPLTMDVINEPTRPGFHPHAGMVVRNAASLAPVPPDKEDPQILPGASARWAYIVRTLFTPADGLATEQCVATITLNPGSIGEPHAHRPGREEVWTALDGTSLLWLGSELRTFRPGMAFMLRPDGVTTHSSVNNGNQPVTFLYFVRLPDYAPPVPNRGHS